MVQSGHHPGRVDQDETLHPLGELNRELGGDEAAHRVPHHRDRAEAEVLAELLAHAGVRGDRDLLGRHLRDAEAR